jgi:multidrug resistance protein, MATE family
MQALATATRSQYASIARISGPLIVNNLAVAGMNFADTVMSGRLGADSLAAVAVGANTWMLVFSACLGLLMAISPIIARLYGAGELDKIGRYSRHGMYIGFGLGIVILVFGRPFAETFLTFIGIDPAFRSLTVDYVRVLLFGAPGILVFIALRFTVEGIGYTRPIMFTSLFSLFCNVMLNYALMFGKFGAPALGVIGCAWASAITMWLVAIALGLYVTFSPRLKELGVFSRIGWPRLHLFREVISLGLPISVTITAEVGLFAVVSILVGTRGVDITAAHQIALSYASTMFMVPLALASATTVQVGHMLGSGQPQLARTAGFAGISMSATFMAVSAFALLVFRNEIITIYTDDPVVTGIALSLLFVAAIFQVADGIQIAAAAALRAYKDTRWPMAINLFAFWVVALPLAYLAAIRYQLPANQIWVAFIVGLVLAAALLSWRFNRLSRA